MCDTSGEIFSNGQVDEVAAENFGVDQPQFNEEASVLASDQPKANAEAQSFGDDGTAEEAEITHDALKQLFGRNIVDVANHFGVCVSTVKRKCRKYGIDRWPPHKRNKGNCIKSNPMLPNNTEPANPLPSPKGKSITATEDEEIDGIYSMIVKATYRKDNAMFPLCSDSGIEELRKELYKRFELKDEKIKIRYKDETGDLIIISCNEDLEFRMRTLRKSGITVMRLSASLVTK
ncbi:OLC1v1025242C1 [Oldenlandia corymbosa var. corymbosa]|uniref:OLC1v1025242C1 n=1 Tax=Oldenlandia corymbosa var. corymbosa TaxID=529605 RepID=A0AAV1C6E6_OLDCO|nr:OLC1v1025242C1 [Oldenlandia corymbosa var. corymbosa]